MIQIDFSNITWERIVEFSVALGIVTGIMKGLSFIVEYYRGSQESVYKRVERVKKMDQILEYADDFGDYREKITKLREDITYMKIKIDQLEAEDSRHTQGMEDSVEQRKILFDVLEALIEEAVRNGANGKAHAALESIKEYKNKKVFNQRKGD